MGQMEMKCISYFYVGQGYSGERCGPWASCFSIIKQRLLDVHKQHVLENIIRSPKGYLYQHLIDNFCLQTYLRKPTDRKYLRLLAKFRLSNHPLNIEIGRHRNVVKINRTSP
jgi:hypothetical protein